MAIATPAPAPPQAFQPPPAWRRPALVGIGAAAATVIVSVGNPNTTHIPLCPFKAVTGYDCAFCGSLRATHSLTHGDVRGALDHNVLFTIGVPFAVVLWAVWMLQSLGYQVGPQLRMPRALLLVLIGVAVAFAVIRNLPAFHWLAST